MRTGSLILGGVALGALGLLYTDKGKTYRTQLLNTVKGWVDKLPEEYKSYIPEGLGLTNTTASSVTGSQTQTNKFTHTPQY